MYFRRTVSIYWSMGEHWRFIGLLPRSTARLASAMFRQTPRNRNPVPISLRCVASNASQQLPALTIWPRCRSASAKQQIERELRHLAARRCTVLVLPVCPISGKGMECPAKSAILESLDYPGPAVNRQGVHILVYQRFINKRARGNDRFQ
jgi:hypothetical protein